MRVAKWGDDLAVRLPQSVVEALSLKEGDRVELRPAGEKSLEVTKEEQSGIATDPAERQRLIEKLRAMRGSLPSGFKFDRDEANER